MAVKGGLKVNIDQSMQYLRKALEMDAYIHVKFHGATSKMAAEEIASDFSQMLNIPYYDDENRGANWFCIKDYQKGVDITVFYQLSEEEKRAELLKQLSVLDKDKEDIA